jgi:hypothetical protein
VGGIVPFGGRLSSAVLSWPWERLSLATSTGGSDSNTAAGQWR